MQYWPEPGAEQRAVRLVPEVARFRSYLNASLFPDFDTGVVRLVLYRDRQSYDRYRPGTINSLAHFHIETAVVHQPVDIVAEGWKHELVHAVLYGRSKAYPFWMQEGAALLLQNADRQQHLCGATLRLPAGLHSFRSRLMEKRLPLPLHRTADLRREGIYEETAQAGYFAFFLWQRRQFIALLQKAATSEQDSFLILLGGDYDLLKSMEEDFYNWLRSPLPLQPSSGC